MFISLKRWDQPENNVRSTALVHTYLGQCHKKDNIKLDKNSSHLLSKSTKQDKQATDVPKQHLIKKYKAIEDNFKLNDFIYPVISLNGNERLKTKSLRKSKTSWIQTTTDKLAYFETQKKLKTILKQSILKESSKLDSSSNVFFQRALKKGSFSIKTPNLVDINEFKVLDDEPNEFLVDYDLIQYLTQPRKPINSYKPSYWINEGFRIEDVFNEAKLNIEIEFKPPTDQPGLLTEIGKTDISFDFQVEIPIVSNSSFSMHVSNYKLQTWYLKRADKSKPIDTKYIEEQVLNEPSNENELKFKVQTVYIPTENPIRDIQLYVKVIKGQKNTILNKWNFSKLKLTRMSWTPFVKLSKQKILEEELSDRKNLEIPIYSPDSLQVKSIKQSELDESLTLKKGMIENKAVVSVGVNESISSSDTSHEEVNDFKINVTKYLVNETLLQDQPSSKIVEASNIPEKKEMPFTSLSTMRNQLNKEPKSIQNIEITETQGTESFLQETSPKASKAPSQKNKSNTELSEIELLAFKKRKMQQPKLDVAGISTFPLLEALNYSTKLYETDITSKKTDITSKKTAALVCDQDISEPEVKIVDEEDIMGTFLEGSILDSKVNINYAMSELIPKESKKFRRIAINTNLSEKNPSLYFQLENISEHFENKFIIHEFSVDEQNSQLQFDIFINESCGVIMIKPIQIYQVDSVTKEPLFFQNLSKIVPQIQSLIVLLLIDSISETDTKLIIFLDDCDKYGIKVYQIGNNSKSILAKLSELVISYGTIIETDLSSNNINDLTYNNEHQFLFNCGLLNPLLVKFILENITLQEFVELSHYQRLEMFKDIVSVELLEKLDDNFPMAMRS